jgi:hypothetical protein
MTTEIADFYALTSRPAPEKFHGAGSDCAIRQRARAPAPHDSIDAGCLSQADTRIEEFGTLSRRERPDGL